MRSTAVSGEELGKILIDAGQSSSLGGGGRMWVKEFRNNPCGWRFWLGKSDIFLGTNYSNWALE